MNEIQLQKVNQYIKENCICDGMGPLDGMSDIGKFSGLTKDDLLEIMKIINCKG